MRELRAGRSSGEEDAGDWLDDCVVDGSSIGAGRCTPSRLSSGENDAPGTPRLCG